MGTSGKPPSMREFYTSGFVHIYLSQCHGQRVSENAEWDLGGREQLAILLWFQDPRRQIKADLIAEITALR